MKEKNSEKLGKLNYLLILAPLLFLIILGIYFSNFHNGFSDSKADFGTFGDFVGGSLNPILAFFSLYAIIYTIKIQLVELEYTREEMTKSREAQEEQSESFKTQNLSIKQQTFENTFFNMINLYNQVIKGLSLERKKEISDNFTEVFIPNIIAGNKLYVSEKDYRGKEVVNELLNIFKFYKDLYYKKQISLKIGLYEDFHKEYEYNIAHYFVTIYQILKFIDNSLIQNKDFYINLFRSQFSKTELNLLFYHSTSKVAKRKFTPLLIKYEFFEHINIKELDPLAVEIIIKRTEKLNIELNSNYSDFKIFGK